MMNVQPSHGSAASISAPPKTKRSRGRSRIASAHSAAPESSTAAGTPGVIVVDAASAGGERPTSAAPAVAYGSGTIRRASAAASTKASASSASIYPWTARAPPIA